MVQRKFDRIHEQTISWNGLDLPATVTSATIIPIIMNDDAKGDPMSFNANPEHAGWSEVAEPNCYPDSEIRNLKIQLDVWLYEVARETTHTLPRFEYALIACAFPEDLDAIDELSGASLKTILELQKETTDRQCYPLWNAVDMNVPGLLPAGVPGLT